MMTFYRKFNEIRETFKGCQTETRVISQHHIVKGRSSENNNFNLLNYLVLRTTTPIASKLYYIFLIASCLHFVVHKICQQGRRTGFLDFDFTHESH